MRTCTTLQYDQRPSFYGHKSKSSNTDDTPKVAPTAIMLFPPMREVAALVEFPFDVDVPLDKLEAVAVGMTVAVWPAPIRVSLGE